jgi:hypothetical protein
MNIYSKSGEVVFKIKSKMAQPIRGVDSYVGF